MRRKSHLLRWIALSCAWLALAQSGALCQSPAERASLIRLQDSLAAVSDSADLRRVYRELSRTSHRDADDPLLQLRLGFFALRLAELGADPDASEALGRLHRVTKRRPEWPTAWHAVGRAEALRAGWEQNNPLALGSRIGLGTLERAAGRQHRALEADPGYVPAALALAGLTLSLRDTSRLAAARDVLRRAAAASHRPPEDFYLALGQVERAAGDALAADDAFAHYMAAGGNHALGLLERARTGLARGEESAESLYFAGAASDDSVARAGYRADLAPIADDSTLAWFDRLRGPRLAEYLRRFWSDRDRYEMRAAGERLREHYRRLHHARRSFALTVSRRFYGPADAYRSGSTELDDRGVIYVRHGEPTERVRPFVFGLMPHESWRYGRAEGDLVLHFSAGYDQRGGGDLYDYRLVESVLDLRGTRDVPRDQLLLSRQSLSPVYNRMLNWGAFGAARSRAQERGMGQASIAVGTSTDSYELQFARPLAAVADLIAVGSSPGGSLAHLVFAVKTGARTRVRLVAFPEGNGRPVALDTTVDLASGRGTGDETYHLGRVELELPAGRWTWRAALAQAGGAGLVLPSDSVRVAGGAGLQLSDLALGSARAAARWSPVPADTVLFTPLELLGPAGEVGLYYEAGGADPDATYRHQIAVYRLKADWAKKERRPAVSLEFHEPAGGTTLRSHRTLQLQRLKPGTYLIEVRLTAPNGAASVRQRRFLVTKPR